MICLGRQILLNFLVCLPNTPLFIIFGQKYYRHYCIFSVHGEILSLFWADLLTLQPRFPTFRLVNIDCSNFYQYCNTKEIFKKNYFIPYRFVRKWAYAAPRTPVPMLTYRTRCSSSEKSLCEKCEKCVENAGLTVFHGK